MEKAKDFWTGKKFWNENSQARDGLLAQNKQGKKEAAVEQTLVDFIDTYFDPNELVYLAGNSIHIDRRFIYKYMPRVEAKLHYRMLDVTGWKIVFENRLHKKFSEPKQHRALDDIRRSRRELEYYLKKIKS